jgi:hypothetical protein
MITPSCSQVVLPLAGGRSDELAAAELMRAVRRAGLDLRRRLSVSFVIEFAGRRDDAFAAATSMRQSDWSGALYGDAGGWALRLNRSRRLTRDAVHADVTEVHRVAEQFGGRVRGVTIEDLQQDDVWGLMAASLQTGSRRRGDRHEPAAQVVRQQVR